MDYDTTTLQTFRYNDDLVINVPSEVSVKVDSSSYYYLLSFDQSFYSQDKNSGTSYSLTITYYPEYYYNSESDFLKKLQTFIPKMVILFLAVKI